MSASAGQRLRRRMNATLKRAADDAGIGLELDEIEAWLIDRACELEDWRLVLEARRDTEAERGAGAATVANLSAELRRVVTTTAGLLARVDFHGPAPSVEQKRWNPQAARRVARRGPGRPGASPLPVA
jgi:hypothetical protein